MNAIQSILKIVFWRNDGNPETCKYAAEGDHGLTPWTPNHHLVEKTVKKLIANDDICEIRVVNGFDMMIFCWDYENGITVDTQLLEVI